MRRAARIEYVQQQIHQQFDADVADALTSDEDVLHTLARKLNDDYDGDPEGMAAALGGVAEDVTDGLADWLVDNAEHAAKWLYKQL